MTSQSDVREIDEGKATSKRRFDQRDWSYIAEFVQSEWDERKRCREDRERQWKEIDRQVDMVPDISHKKMPDGRIDQDKRWMAEMELPLQAQALEVITADCRRMMFPDLGTWFCAHAQVTDEYLRGVDFSAIILGDETEVPSQITQDNADKLVEGFMLHQFRQYDLMTRFDMINAETIKYGMGVARAKMQRKNVYIHEARGVRREEQRLPVLVPGSIKHTYLDEPLPSMHSATEIGQAHIVEDNIRFENLVLAAGKGSTDPDDEDGGWMPMHIGKLIPDDKGYVKILEMEGDIVVPRKTTRSMVIPGAVVTVAVGGAGSDGKSSRAVVRFRFRKQPFSSFLLFPYHYESVDNAYPTSPLMKGRPVQMMATDALNRLMDSGALRGQPPISWDHNDPVLAAQGGPKIYPSAQWGSADPNTISVHSDVGGDPAVLAAILSQAINLYADLTGVLPSRLGAQTKSHTTAYSKESELQRGAVRTVDYVRQAGSGPITRWLDMAYQMGRNELKASQSIAFWIDAYGGFVDVNKSFLPEKVDFEWYGSGGPAEEQQKMNARIGSLNLAAKMDQLQVSMGRPPTLNIDAAIRQVLREGKWTDVDTITNSQSALAGPAAAPMLPGPSEVGPGPAIAALQTLTGPTA
jgi:hypothetical protein